MKLSEIVRINEKGLVANAVNLKMMDDSEKNLQLCQGFIFNYDAKKPKESTVGVLVKIRESFFGANTPNVHLIVQDYGKGKSHFALVVANFFKRSADSEEVKGSLHQIEMAVGSHRHVYDELIAYKERSKPHLVIPLSGDQMTDLKAAFLKSLRAELEAAEVTESIGQHLCAAPMNFLRHLEDAGKKKAEQYLAETQPNLNVDTLVKELGEDNYSLIHLVKEISREIHGHPFEFESNLDLEVILAAVVKKLCSGPDARFAGVLILFDELLPYLQGWANDPGRHGGAALQNLTNACENHESKIALVTFSQVRPQVRSGVPLQSLNDYNKLTSRLEKLESTYEPRASLELVIDNLIIHEEMTAEWKEFEHRWHSTLKADSQQVFNDFVPKYKEQGWSLPDFHKHLGVGSFPLHPLTTCLLANLEFTQNRTVISFIKQDVKAHIEAENVEFNGKPNYIYAYQLVGAFKPSLSGHSIYHDYQKARDQIQATADADHLRVLDSLFLYYASGQKLTKKAEDEHSKILSAISGLSEMTVRTALNDLHKNFHVLHYINDSKLYRFYQGASPAEVERLIDDEIGDEQSTLAELARHCEQLPFFTQIPAVTPDGFVNEFQLVGDDWQYKKIVIPAQEIEKMLSAQSKLPDGRGVVAHILYEKEQDKQSVYEQIQKLLALHPENYRILTAVPEEAVGDLQRMLKQKSALEGVTQAERQRLGAAFEQQLEDWSKILSSRLEKAVTRAEYYCIGMDKLLPSERKNPQELISQMLRQAYRFVPPVARMDKMRGGSTTGSQVSGFIAKQLLLGDEILHSSLPNRSFKTIIDGIFVDSWKLFVKTSDRYKVNPPEHRNVKMAWDEINNLTTLGDAESKEISVEEIWKMLSSKPFGYNELTFTVLFTAWLAIHRREVAFKGDLSIPQKAREAPERKKLATPISEWANTNVFDKPREFLSEWAPKKQNLLIRRRPASLPTVPEHCDYDEAKELLKQIEAFLTAGNGEPDQREEAKKNKDELLKAVKSLDNWAEVVLKLDELAKQADLNILLSNVCSKRKSCYPPKGTSGKPSVVPSEELQSLSTSVLTRIDSLVRAKINGLAFEAERITSDQQYGEYQNKVKTVIGLLSKDLPESFKETLQTAIQVAKASVENRKGEDAIRTVMNELKEIGNLMDATTSQNWCATKLERLDSLAQIHPQITENGVFQSARQKIEACLKTLSQQLSKWEQKLPAVTNLQEANALRNEINRQSNRYTETADGERVESLLEQVDRACNEFQKLERAKTNQEAAFDGFKQIMEGIGGAELQRIPGIYEDGRQKQNSLMESYQSDAPFVSLLKAEWERAQERIRKRLTEIASQELSEISQHGQLKAKLESAAEVAGIDDFAEFAPRLTTALGKLEAKREELRIEQADREILKQINEYTARHQTTVAALDEAEENIRQQRAALHRPEKFTSDIQKAFLVIEEKRSRHSRQLEELEGRVNQAKAAVELNTLEKDMLRAESTFKGSSLSEKFDALQAKLRELRGTSELLAVVSNEAEKSRTIADYLKAKAQCEEVAAQIKGSRFEGQIDELISQVERNVERFVGQLADLEKQLREGGLEQVKKLRQKLSRCSNQYENSPYQEAFDQLMLEAETIEKLLELGHKQPSSIENAQQLLEEAERLKGANNAETVQRRGEEVHATLIERHNSLRKEEEKKAQKRLEGYFQKWKEIELSPDTISKIRLGEEFLREVHQHKPVLNQYLPTEHQSDIDELIKAVHSVLDSDRETQICEFFNKLPDEVRVRVYARLGELIAPQRILMNGQLEVQPMAGDHA